MKEGFNAVALVKGVKVGMRWEVDSLPNGLHIHYQLVPRDTVNVSLVDIYALFPYDDWVNAPFDFNDNEGNIPDQPTPVAGSNNWLLRQADSAPISIGPSPGLGGLAFQMTSEGLHLQLSDNRYYDRNLAVIYSHRESGSDWAWGRGEKKDFDFVLTFNRPMAPWPCSSPTATPSGPLPPTATPTITATPYPPDCLDTLIDDFDDPLRNASSGRTNRWGGKWTTAVSTKSRVSVAYQGPGYGQSRFCALVSGENPKDKEEGVVAFQTGLFGNGAPFNAAIHGVMGIQLWVKGEKGDGHSFWVNLYSAAHPNDPYCFNIVPPAGIWTPFRIPFGQMALKSWWGSERGARTSPDGTDLTAVGIEYRDRGTFAFSLGRVSFYHPFEPNCPQPSLPLEPTLSFTPTASATPRVIPSLTPTFTPRPTDTAIPSPTRPPNPTPTPRPLPTRVITARPTPAPRAVAGPSSAPTYRVEIKPTPTWVWRRSFRPSVFFPSWTPTPTLTAAFHTKGYEDFPPNLDLDHVIYFANPPANIYVTFADGPGNYEVRVTDSQGRELEVIYRHKVVSESDAWLEWDGQDSKGRQVQPGSYYVTIYKEGKALKSLVVVRTGGLD